MLVINLLKPFYINEVEKTIRMGNFKDTAKEIQYETDNFITLFKYLKTPISKKNLINKLTKEIKISKEELSNIIDYLIEENFIINYEDYKKILLNNKLNRQNLFFSMTNGNIKNWDLLNQPNILILGLGGVGANTAVTLSRAGFTNFTLIDFDKIESSNLIRQLPYNENDIGKYKTEVLKNKIKTNNNIINTFNKKILQEKDIEQEISNSDFVICTLDKPLRIIRRLINKLCVKHNKPLIFSGFAEHTAMIGPFVVPKKSACLKCIEKELQDKTINNVEIVPSYGPLCLLISSIISNEIINYFYQFNLNNLIRKTLMINILSYEQNIITWNKNKECEVCKNDSK